MKLVFIEKPMPKEQSIFMTYVKKLGEDKASDT